MATEIPTREQVAEALGNGMLMDVGDALERAGLPKVDTLEPTDGNQLYFSGGWYEDDPDEPGERIWHEWGFTLAVVETSEG